MGSRRCCCQQGPTTCEVFAETLAGCVVSIGEKGDRTGDWEKRYRDWSILDEDPPNCEFPEFGTTEANGLIVCQHPTVYTGQCVSAFITADSGNTPRLILNYNYETLEFLYVEFDVDGNTVEFGKGYDYYSDEVFATFTDVSIAGDELVWAWVTRIFSEAEPLVTLSAITGGQTVCQEVGWVCCDSTLGLYAGLGSGAGGARFHGGDTGNTFRLLEHTDNYDECCDCDCQCDGWCVPRNLSYTLTPDAGNNSCCDDIITGTLRPTLVYYPGVGDINHPCEWMDEVEFECAGGETRDLRLRATGGRNRTILDFENTSGAHASTGPNEESQCKPFYWKGTITFYFEIAEEPYYTECLYTLEIYEP